MATLLATELTLEQACEWIRRLDAALREHRDCLTDLDAAIGDADHGINMERGFAAVRRQVEAAPPSDLGTLFKTVGATLISTVGGASGPLYGTAFLRMAGALAGRVRANGAELAVALAVAYEGIAARGKSSRGEKTLLDAFGPALDVFQRASATDQDLASVAAEAATAAEHGARATIPLLATKGRASFLGEKSLGHQDPGATSTALVFRSLAASLET